MNASVQDDFVWKIRFSPDEYRGLLSHCVTRYRSNALQPTQSKPEVGQYDRNLAIRVEASRDHGLITVPIRLPRHLMPEWSTQDWINFIDGEVRWLTAGLDECAVLNLSLAIADVEERRRNLLKEAKQVVIDFRGDLPNGHLPMMLGGYKVGIYRSGNYWPIWLSIQPTYDLAIREAESICEEARISKSDPSIIAVGKLADVVNPAFVKRYGLGLIQSSKVNEVSLWMLCWPVLLGVFAGIAIGWWLKVGLEWISN